MTLNDIYFTADTHFNHANIIKYCKRKEQSIDEMNKNIIDTWNSVVPYYGTVFHLGDVGFFNDNNDNLIYQLHGLIVLIRGNHDRKMSPSFKRRFAEIVTYKVIQFEDINITLHHRPLNYWKGIEENHWHLHGHTHGEYLRNGKTIDVGVDTNDYKPYSMEDMKKIMNSKTDNQLYADNYKQVDLDRFQSLEKYAKDKEQ